MDNFKVVVAFKSKVAFLFTEDSNMLNTKCNVKLFHSRFL